MSNNDTPPATRGDEIYRDGDEQDDEYYHSLDTPEAAGLVEVGADDFPSHFDERDGRLFHSNRASAYPLPADTPEQERMIVVHNILNRLLGANYVGPVQEVLTQDTGRRRKLVVDLCTGTGRWAMEMAQEFPNVLFRGVDIVPIATRYPLPNVRFEIHDVNDGLRWEDGSVDIVHARNVSMAINDYRRTLLEIARVLRSGGLFISVEFGRYPAFHPSFGIVDPQDVEGYTPASSNFFSVVNEALAERGIHPIAGSVHAMLAGTGLYHSIAIYPGCYVPIGRWSSDESSQRVGGAYRAAMLRYANSVKTMLRDAGWSEQQWESIYEDYKRELLSVRGLVGVYHIVVARRR